MADTTKNNPVESGSPTWQTPPNKTLVVLVGGVAGLALVALGAILAWRWWDTLFSGRAAWKEWKPWAPVLSTITGLAVMFVALLTLRSEERRNPAARRLIYGYNTVLTGLLLLAVLGVVDLFGAIYASQIFDWTATNIYSISPVSEKILEQLDKPVKIYVLMSPEDAMYPDLETLLLTCKNYSDKIDVENVSRMSTLRELFSKYALQNDTGVVVVYDPEGQSQHQAILINDLEDLSARMTSQERQRVFKGEQAIVSAIQALQRGKVTQTIYFTQDSGEMKLSDFNPSRDPRRLDRGLGALKGKLEKSNFTVKDWSLSQVDPKTRTTAAVPDDAAALVLAGPTELTDPQTGPAKIKALEEYMKRPEARLLVLLETDPYRREGIAPTGLEAFLAGYGVQVGRDIILHPVFDISRDPTSALVRLSDSCDKAFQEGLVLRNKLFPMMNMRTVQPAGPDNPSYTVNRLIETVPVIRGLTGQWAETNLRGDPTEFVQTLEEKQQAEFEQKLKSPVVAVAVTVREKTGPSNVPPDPIHSQVAGDSKPRIVVFGGATFVCNSLVDRADLYQNLFNSCIAWLGERQKDILVSDIPPKERKAYKLNTKASEINSMVFTPLVVLMLCIVCCGVGVWFMRRH
jgi:hypothetical protein